MKQELRKHLQKYCDVSNWSRMHRPRKGKENFEAGEALAEEIIDMMLDYEPGYNGTAIMMTALAMVRSYVKNAICFSNAFDINSDVKLLDQYEELFDGDFWMGARQDSIQSEITRFISGK